MNATKSLNEMTTEELVKMDSRCIDFILGGKMNKKMAKSCQVTREAIRAELDKRS